MESIWTSSMPLLAVKTPFSQLVKKSNDEWVLSTWAKGTKIEIELTEQDILRLMFDIKNSIESEYKISIGEITTTEC